MEYNGWQYQLHADIVEHRKEFQKNVETGYWQGQATVQAGKPRLNEEL